LLLHVDKLIASKKGNTIFSGVLPSKWMGGIEMSRHKVMSEALKQEIAKRLGVDDIVASEGWGSVSSRNCGNIVREAIEMAERSRT
jgi:small acid-soluble spore protein F (minor alpha/beta-type SASP)